MELKTLTGKDLFEAFRELDRQLPQHAYKKIEGGKGGRLGLTDIIPAFLPDLLLELFGPIGYGWGFHLHSMESSSKTVERSKGYTEEEITATCKLAIWYRFVCDGETVISDPIPATGGSTNTLVEWAMKGALTNALGCAWFFAGYQLSVYKNERSHNGNGDNPGKSHGASQRHKGQWGCTDRRQQVPHNTQAEKHDAMSSINRLLASLQLPEDRYWQYAGAKYGAARDSITAEQLKEQNALLTQCRQNPAKLEQFKKLLIDMADRQSERPKNHQGAMH